jgi:hypothetical protein
MARTVGLDIILFEVVVADCVAGACSHAACSNRFLVAAAVPVAGGSRASAYWPTCSDVWIASRLLEVPSHSAAEPAPPPTANGFCWVTRQREHGTRVSRFSCSVRHASKRTRDGMQPFSIRPSKIPTAPRTRRPPTTSNHHLLSLFSRPYRTLSDNRS